MGHYGFNILNPPISCRIEQVRVTNNGSHGILGSTGSYIDNTVQFNGGEGIRAHLSLVRGNSVSGNASHGIRSTQGQVTGNVVFDNGGDGVVFAAGNGGLALDNLIRDNTGLGINGVPGTAYARNRIDNNSGGTVSLATEIGTNMCDGDTTCP